MSTAEEVELTMNERFNDDFEDFGWDPDEHYLRKWKRDNVLAPPDWVDEEVEACLKQAAFDSGIPTNGTIIIPAENNDGEIFQLFYYPYIYYTGRPRRDATYIDVSWPPGATETELAKVLHYEEDFRETDSEASADTDDDKVLFERCEICEEAPSIGDKVIPLPCGCWFHSAFLVAKLREKANCPKCKARTLEQLGANDPRIGEQTTQNGYH